MTKSPNPDLRASVLTSLRALAPDHAVSFDVALRVAEAQARLLRTFAKPTPEHPLSSFIAQLPHIRIEYRRELPPGDIFFWHRPTRAWVIRLPAEEDLRTQGVRVLRAFKQIVDHRAERLYDPRWLTGQAQRRIAAEHFAVSALVPLSSLQATDGKGSAPLAQLAARCHAPLEVVSQRRADLRALDFLSQLEPEGAAR